MFHCQGIDPVALKEIMASSQKGLLGMFNMFSGGAVTRMAIFALSVSLIHIFFNYSSVDNLELPDYLKFKRPRRNR